MAIHSSYLVNLASATPEFHRKSVKAFRGELERALAFALSIWCFTQDRFVDAAAKKAWNW